MDPHGIVEIPEVVSHPPDEAGGTSNDGRVVPEAADVAGLEVAVSGLLVVVGAEGLDEESVHGALLGVLVVLAVEDEPGDGLVLGDEGGRLHAHLVVELVAQGTLVMGRGIKDLGG